MGGFQESGQMGHDETVEFLSKQTDFALIEEYSDWVLTKYPEKGLSIFTAGKRPVALPPDDVAQFLRKKSPELYEQFVEYLIFKKKNSNGKFHTSLGELYIDKMVEHFREHNVTEAKEGSDAAVTRAKLLDHLKVSDCYDVELLLARTKETALYHEQVILYTKAAQPDKALRILVHSLKDFTGAEAYCRITASDDLDSSELLILLLKTYLETDEEGKPFYEERAIAMLNSTGADLDLIRVLEVLPPGLSLRSLKRFFPDVIRSQHSEFREGRSSRI